MGTTSTGVVEVSTWITVTQAAEITSLSPKTIRRLIERGLVRATKPSPRVLRVDASSLNAYMDRFATDQWHVLHSPQAGGAR